MKGIFLFLYLLPLSLTPTGNFTEAGKWIDKIYLYQSAGACVSKISSFSQEEKKEFFMNFGPYSRADGKFFLEGCHCFPGCGNYPQDLDLQDLKEAMQNDSTGELKLGVQDPLTVIKYENGEYSAIPYHEFYREDLIPLSKALLKIKTHDPTLSMYLKKRAEEILSDNFLQGDDLWMKIKGELKAYFGPVEVEDPYFHVKMAYGGIVFKTRPFEFPMTIKDLLPYFQRHLPDKRLKLESPPDYPGLELADLLEAYGIYRTPPVISFVVLPPFLPEKAKKYLFVNVLREKFQRGISKAGAKIKDWKGDFPSYIKYLTLHDFFHFLIVKKPSEKILPSSLEEIKADSSSVFFLPFLVKKRIISEEEARKIEDCYLANLLFYAAHNKAPAIMQINFLLLKGGIRIGEGGKIERMLTFEKNINEMWKETIKIMQDKRRNIFRKKLVGDVFNILSEISQIDFYPNLNKTNKQEE